MTTTISAIRATYPTISLKRICDELGLCYQYVLKASKLPVKGTAYDPDAFNDEAVAKIVDKKGVDLDSVDWEAISKEERATTPVGKPDDFSVGTCFKLREPKERQKQGISPVYEIVYVTPSHCVFVDHAEPSQPRVMNWDTFLHQSPRIVASETKQGA